jgi:hypothetical protein
LSPSASLPFTAPGLDPFALAHDAVSRRFLLGDRRAHRLLIVDELSRNVVTYVGAASAGFLDRLTAFTIDGRRGDLWVASAQGDGEGAESALHKLQLVSGRGLLEARAPKGAGAVQIVAIAAAADGTVYALDARGPKLFRLRPGARTLEHVMRVDARDPSAIAAADDGTLYVADAAGLIRLDPAARTAARVKTAEDLSGFESIAWRAGGLVGIERLAGSYLVARVKLDASGTRAQPRQILAASPTAAVGTLAGDGFYYLTGDQTIRRVAVR